MIEDVQNDADCSSKDDYNTKIMDVKPLAIIPNSPQSMASCLKRRLKKEMCSKRLRSWSIQDHVKVLEDKIQAYTT